MTTSTHVSNFLQTADCSLCLCHRRSSRMLSLSSLSIFDTHTHTHTRAQNFGKKLFCMHLQSFAHTHTWSNISYSCCLHSLDDTHACKHSLFRSCVFALTRLWLCCALLRESCNRKCLSIVQLTAHRCQYKY